MTAPWQVAAVAIATVLVCWLALAWGWNADPPAGAAPHSGWGWPAVAVPAALGVGWLAWRGHGVAGTFAIFVPLVLLSGWRLEQSGTPGWPFRFAGLVFVLCLVCIAAGGVGAWTRYRLERRQTREELDLVDAELDDLSAEPSPAEPSPVPVPRGHPVGG